MRRVGEHLIALMPKDGQCSMRKKPSYLASVCIQDAFDTVRYISSANKRARNCYNECKYQATMIYSNLPLFSSSSSSTDFVNEIISKCSRVLVATISQNVDWPY